MHKIDFLNENDKYNPFSIEHQYIKIERFFNDEINNMIINYIMHQDLIGDKKSDLEEIHQLVDHLYPCIKTIMEEDNIEFKRSSKYFMQAMFMMMKFINSHSLIKFFFQLLGTSNRNKVNFTSLVFLKCIVENI